MNEYQKQYMRQLEYTNADPDMRDGYWTPCDFDEDLIESWEEEAKSGGINEWIFRFRDTKGCIDTSDIIRLLNGEWCPPLYPTNPSLHTHPTGALRESKEGKGKPHLFLAGFPRAIMALCRHMDCELGRERNWEKGLPESSLIDSQFRHLMGYVSGVSEDSPEYNLTANVWNAMVMLEEYLRVQDGVMSEEVLDVSKPE